MEGIGEKKTDGLNEAEQVLLGKLKEWRSEVSKEHGVPSYVVAKNEHLIAIVKNKPHTLQELRLINGIGEKKIKDKKLIKLIRKIIKNGGSIDKGLPIGNLTSQFFANIYLNEMDHYLKEILKVKSYVRYMDDFVLIDEDIKFLKKVKYEIQIYLENNLNLKLKKEATFTNKVDNGIPFCGVRIFKKYIRIRKGSLQISIDKIKRKKICLNRKKFQKKIL